MKSLVEFINEEKKTTGDGSIQMIQTIIDQLCEHPDMKGKDKEVWKSAGQFLWDYLKELDKKSLQNIMDTFGFVKMSDWEGCKPEDVQLGMHMFLMNGNKSNCVMKGITEYINDMVIFRPILCEAKVMLDRIPMSLQEYCSDEKNLSEGPEDVTILNGFKEPREDDEAFVIATQNFKSGLEYAKKNVGKDDYKNAFIVLPFDNCNVVVKIDFRKDDIHNAGVHIVGPKDVNIKSVISISRSAFEFYKDLYAKEEDLNDKMFKALGELQKKSEDKFSAEKQADAKMPSPDKSPYTLSKKKRFPEYLKHATVKANGKDFIYKNTWNGEAEIFVQTVQKDGKKYYKVLMGDVDSSFENGRDLTDVYYLTTLGQLDKFLEFTLKPARRKQHAELGADGEIHRWSSAMNKTLPASLKKDIIKDEQLIKDLDFKYFDIYDLYK